MNTAVLANSFSQEGIQFYACNLFKKLIESGHKVAYGYLKSIFLKISGKLTFFYFDGFGA